ncbi:MAG: LLM class flavin-dependent oxidoreductase [Micromonosporaceae bacterium]|nr:LLM class flavin-dependent oxidoreductase [Micromonosporaceae bacterium]
MRIGLLISGMRPPREAVAVARDAERAGVADLWISEDYFERGAFTVATAVATGTDRARVGIGVVNPFTRHPLVTAMEFATLDELSGGRAVLGLGASNRVWIEDRCGIPFTAPLAAVREATAVIRAALAGERVTTAGRHFRTDARLSFPAARPDPPIHLGTKGRRGLRLAGEVADGVLLSLLAAPRYVRWARELTARPEPPETGAYVLAACAADAGRARAAVRRPLATYLGVHGRHDLTRVAGLPAELADGFRTAWLAGDPAEHLVTDALIDTFAVAGDPAQCWAGLDRLAAAGLDTAVLRDPGDPTITDLLALTAEYQREHRTDRSTS